MSRPSGCRDFYIAPNQELQVDFEIPEREFPVTHALRIIGETDEFWKWRAERGNPYWLAESVEDALFRGELQGENFCLKLRGNGEKFERNAYMDAIAKSPQVLFAARGNLQKCNFRQLLFK